MSDVLDNVSDNRFEVTLDGNTGELTYSVDGDAITLIHTGVPEELEGHGLAGQLVRAAADRARRDGLTIIPVCPYARSWLRKHEAEFADVTVGWTRAPEE